MNQIKSDHSDPAKRMNRGQSDAMRHLDGPCMVIAPPGSGKTFTLTKRIEYLTEHARICPASILVITFTKAAAKEMQERFFRLTGQRRTEVTFGTFHAVYLDILKKSFHYRSEDVLTEQEKQRIYMSLSEAVGLEEDQFFESERFFAELSRMKNTCQKIDEYEPLSMERQLFRELGGRYLQVCKNGRKLDFDDMALLCREALLSHPEELRRWQNRFSYILVDEFQDINRAQYDVIRLLAEPEQNLFVVGDDDQSIYGFRGADPSIMLSLAKDYPKIRRIALQVNYRSGQTIRKAADRLIRNNRLRFEKKVTGSGDNRGNVRICMFPTKEAQAQELMRNLKASGDYEHTALLTRTRSSLAGYAALLSFAGIPFRTGEPIKSLFEHPVVLDVAAYLALAEGSGGRAEFLRIMNKPCRYLSGKAVLKEGDAVCMRELFDGLKDYYRGRANTIELLEEFRGNLIRIRSFPPYAAVNYILKGMGYEAYIIKKAGKNEQKVQEVRQAISFIRDCARGHGSYQGFFKWFQEKKTEYARMSGEEKEQQTPAVTLLTMHGAKGLEYRTVFIPDLNEKTIPHKRAFLPEELEEERRILYVAMTRAKENLFLSCVREDGEGKEEVSRFLKEIECL